MSHMLCKQPFSWFECPQPDLHFWCPLIHVTGICSDFLYKFCLFAYVVPLFSGVFVGQDLEYYPIWIVYDASTFKEIKAARWVSLMDQNAFILNIFLYFPGQSLTHIHPLPGLFKAPYHFCPLCHRVIEFLEAVRPVGDSFYFVDSQRFNEVYFEVFLDVIYLAGGVGPRSALDLALLFFDE